MLPSASRGGSSVLACVGDTAGLGLLTDMEEALRV